MSLFVFTFAAKLDFFFSCKKDDITKTYSKNESIQQTMCHKVVASFKYCWDLIWFCQVRVVGNLIKVKLIMEVAGLVVVP